MSGYVPLKEPEIVGTSLALSLEEREGALSHDRSRSRWYAAYTCANHEKKAQEQFEQRSVESFLPVYESARLWKDRRVRLQMPLFPGYVFVRMAPVDRLRVLHVPGVVRLVGFNGQLSPLPDEEIEGLKRAMAVGTRAEPHPFLTIGRRVKIGLGPLAGLEGIVIRRKNRLRFVISLPLIQRGAAVEIQATDLEPA